MGTAEQKKELMLNQVLAIGNELDSDEDVEPVAQPQNSKMQRQVRAIVNNFSGKPESSKILGISKEKYVVIGTLAVAIAGVVALTILTTIYVKKYRKSRMSQESLDKMFKDPYEKADVVSIKRDKSNDEKIGDALARSHSTKGSQKNSKEVSKQGSRTTSPNDDANLVENNVISWEDPDVDKLPKNSPKNNFV